MYITLFAKHSGFNIKSMMKNQVLKTIHYVIFFKISFFLLSRLTNIIDNDKNWNFTGMNDLLSLYIYQYNHSKDCCIRYD